jgi:mono/diheme cytochrome c family protein
MISRLRFLAPILCVATFAQVAARSVWDGVYTAEQAKRGETAYRTACAKCHGDTLAGGEAAPPLTGGEFQANWNGLTMGDLFERLRLSMPADRPGTLTSAQNADILAYMLTVNQFPAGKKELERQAELLKQIRFESTKPAAP